MSLSVLLMQLLFISDFCEKLLPLFQVQYKEYNNFFTKSLQMKSYQFFIFPLSIKPRLRRLWWFLRRVRVFILPLVFLVPVGKSLKGNKV